jgi:hypothetical protein
MIAQINVGAIGDIDLLKIFLTATPEPGALIRCEQCSPVATVAFSNWNDSERPPSSFSAPHDYRPASTFEVVAVSAFERVLWRTEGCDKKIMRHSRDSPKVPPYLWPWKYFLLCLAPREKPRSCVRPVKAKDWGRDPRYISRRKECLRKSLTFDLDWKTPRKKHWKRNIWRTWAISILPVASSLLRFWGKPWAPCWEYHAKQIASCCYFRGIGIRPSIVLPTEVQHSVPNADSKDKYREHFASTGIRTGS